MLRESPILPPPPTLRPSFLPICPPATALNFPPFQMVMALERAGVLQPTRLFLRGEFLDSRAAFVKFSSVGTQNYFFWLNNFWSRQHLTASAFPYCGRDACFWARSTLSAQPCAIQDEDDQNLSSAQRAVPGILLHTTHQLHTEYYTGCYETMSRPKTLHSERSAVALALALAAPAGPFTPNGDLGNKSRLER